MDENLPQVLKELNTAITSTRWAKWNIFHACKEKPELVGAYNLLVEAHDKLLAARETIQAEIHPKEK